MLIGGCDEVGRGALAGPVLAAAVILPERYHLPGLNDSKKLTARRREQLAGAIKEQALAWALAQVSAADIDRLNIHRASLRAMALAVEQLNPPPDLLLVDGKFTPEVKMASRAIVGGDGLEPCISAASILAKVARDQLMVELDRQMPGYRWAQNKGYGTGAHRAALALLGPSPQHRRSFRPLQQQSLF